MAEAANTKKILAQSLKTMMAEKPFQKISVTDICQACGMNRKSFYYHFRDKYDLLNWIFDTEFLAVCKNKIYADEQAFFRDLCDYFYENRGFYRKALAVSGQNCLADHFRQSMAEILQQALWRMLPQVELTEFQIGFFTDAIVGSYYRWITDRNCMPPDQFIRELEECIYYLVKHYERK